MVSDMYVVMCDMIDEISPMQVIHREYRQSFAHFATSTCAIIGGVLTIAGLIDSAVYGARNRIRIGTGSATGHQDGYESHSRSGKVSFIFPRLFVL